MAITIGNEAYCANLNAGGSNQATYIYLGNGASGAGTVNVIKVYPNSNISGLKVGTFHLDSGTTYHNLASHASEDTLAATSGACRTLSGDGVDFTSFPTDAGEFIGSNEDTGALERNTSGGSGIAYDYDNGQADFGAAVSYDVASYADDQLALYASGTEPVTDLSIHQSECVGTLGNLS